MQQFAYYIHHFNNSAFTSSLLQSPREDCLIPTPPPPTPTPTPPPTPDECAPIQYQLQAPSTPVQVASAETSPRPLSGKYTEAITPPPVTLIPEEEVKEEEVVETVVKVEAPEIEAIEEEEEEEEVLLESSVPAKTRDAPSAMSFSGISPTVSSKFLS